MQALVSEGVVLSLGHTNASYETCMAYQSAGVQYVTHLFNAMSQFGSREPGLVGASLTNDEFMMGLIADGVHVSPETIKLALKAMGGLHRVYLVSDAMAVAGTTLQRFSLDERVIVRSDSRLTLEDGTLAGADLELTRAIQFLVNTVGVELVDVLKSSVTTPRKVLMENDQKFLLDGSSLSDFIMIEPSLDRVQAVGIEQ